MNSYYYSLIQTATATPLLLDNWMTGLALAFSVNKVVTSYTGALIEIRRASDNTTDNFLADINGKISGSSMNVANTTSLTTFLTSTQGYVRTWYNQAGGSNHFQQTTTARQLEIQLASTPTGEALLYASGATQNGLYTLSAIDLATPDQCTFIQTFARDGSPVNGYHGVFSSTTSAAMNTALPTGYFLNFLLDTANIRNDQAGSASDLLLSGSVPTNQVVLRSSFRYPVSGTGSATASNSGTATTSGSSHTLANAHIALGNFSSNRPAKGWFGNFFMWTIDLGATDMNTISEEVDTYYGI